MSSTLRRRFMWFLASTCLGTGCDLHTKAWAATLLSDLPRRTLPVTSWLDLSLQYNRGTAFSLVSDLGSARWIVGLFAVAVVLLVVLLVRRPETRSLDAVALGAVAAGAVGNAYDRFARGGMGVVDFVRVHMPGGWTWPTFNVADVLIAVGAAGVLLRRATPGVPPPDVPPAPTIAAPG
jgi:signal peptidase II